MFLAEHKVELLVCTMLNKRYYILVELFGKTSLRLSYIIYGSEREKVDLARGQREREGERIEFGLLVVAAAAEYCIELAAKT